MLEQIFVAPFQRKPAFLAQFIPRLLYRVSFYFESSFFSILAPSHRLSVFISSVETNIIDYASNLPNGERKSYQSVIFTALRKSKQLDFLVTVALTKLMFNFLPLCSGSTSQRNEDNEHRYQVYDRAPK